MFGLYTHLQSTEPRHSRELVMPTRSASILNSVLFCIADGVLCRVFFCAVAGAVAGARCPSAILGVVVVAAVAAFGDITLTMLRV